MLDLKWSIAGVVDQINYYRSDEPFDNDSNIKPTAVIPGYMTHHVDDYQGYDRLYIRFGIVKNKVETLSDTYYVKPGERWNPIDLDYTDLLYDFTNVEVNRWDDVTIVYNNKDINMYRLKVQDDKFLVVNSTKDIIYEVTPTMFSLDSVFDESNHSEYKTIGKLKNHVFVNVPLEVESYLDLFEHNIININVALSVDPNNQCTILSLKEDETPVFSVSLTDSKYVVTLGELVITSKSSATNNKTLLNVIINKNTRTIKLSINGVVDSITEFDVASLDFTYESKLYICESGEFNINSFLIANTDIRSYTEKLEHFLYDLYNMSLPDTHNHHIFRPSFDYEVLEFSSVYNKPAQSKEIKFEINCRHSPDQIFYHISEKQGDDDPAVLVSSGDERELYLYDINEESTYSYLKIESVINGFSVFSDEYKVRSPLRWKPKDIISDVNVWISSEPEYITQEANRISTVINKSKITESFSQSIIDARPSLVNGCISFDGDNDSLISDNWEIDPSSGADVLNLFMFIKVPTDVVSGYLYRCVIDESTNYNRFDVELNNDKTITINYIRNSDDTLQSITTTQTIEFDYTSLLIAIDYISGKCITSIDGRREEFDIVSISTTSSTDSSTHVIGGAKFDLLELVVDNEIMNVGDQYKLEGWVANKYLATHILEDTHIYKLLVPTVEELKLSTHWSSTYEHVEINWGYDV